MSAAQYQALQKTPHARARNRPVRGEMNALEARYAAYLDLQKLAGRVAEYRFESHHFKLAAKTFYIPDFEIVRADGRIEFHDVKGTSRRKKDDGTVIEQPWAEEDSKVKIKVAARLWPWYSWRIVFERGRKGDVIWSVSEVVG